MSDLRVQVDGKGLKSQDRRRDFSERSLILLPILIVSQFSVLDCTVATTVR